MAPKPEIQGIAMAHFMTKPVNIYVAIALFCQIEQIFGVVNGD